MFGPAGAMVAIYFLGLGKALDLPDFARSVAGWSFLSWSPIATLSTVVVAAELLLPALWFAGIHRRRVACLMIALLVCFGIGGMVQSMVRPPSSCGCYGVWASYLEWSSSLRGDVWKAATIAVLLLPAVVGGLRHPSKGHHPPANWVASRRPGFSLIEVILVVVIVALLVALSAPGLAGARRRAVGVSTAANLASSGQLVTQYLGDWKERFPIVFDPAGEERPYSCGGVERSHHARSGYFLNSELWYRALCGGYFDGPGAPAALRPAERPADGPGPARPFVLPCAFFASPDFWDLATRLDERQYRATALPEVVYPSKKALLLSMYWMYESTPGPIRFGRDFGRWSKVPALRVDLSIAEPTLGDFEMGVLMGDGAGWGRMHTFDAGSYPGYHTERGVRGIDLH